MFNILSDRANRYLLNGMILVASWTLMLSTLYTLKEALIFNTIIIVSVLPIACSINRTRDFKDVDKLAMLISIILINSITTVSLLYNFDKERHYVYILISIYVVALIRIILHNWAYKSSKVTTQYRRLVAALSYCSIMYMFEITILDIALLGWKNGLILSVIGLVVFNVVSSIVTRTCNMGE